MGLFESVYNMLSGRDKNEVGDIIENETKKIISIEHKSEYKNVICGDKNCEEILDFEINVQRINAMTFACDRKFSNERFFDADFVLACIGTGVEKEKNKKYSDNVLDKINEINRIGKNAEDRLKKVYNLSAEKIRRECKEAEETDSREVIDSAVERYFKEYMPVELR